MAKKEKESAQKVSTTYQVVTPLLLDGRLVPVGEQVELDAQTAAELIACGAVEVSAEAQADLDAG